MKKIWIAILIVLVFVIWVLIIYSSKLQNPYLKDYNKITIELTWWKLLLYVADSVDKKRKWLSGISSIKPNEGMIFVYDEPGRYWFWMSGMKFSLDFIWVDWSGYIVWITPKVSPDTYPRVFFPPSKAQYIIELLSGSVEKYGLYTGQKILNLNFFE